MRTWALLPRPSISSLGERQHRTNRRPTTFFPPGLASNPWARRRIREGSDPTAAGPDSDLARLIDSRRPSVRATGDTATQPRLLVEPGGGPSRSGGSALPLTKDLFPTREGRRWRRLSWILQGIAAAILFYGIPFGLTWLAEFLGDLIPGRTLP
jgi:hypothetical protein